jgi:hypothetical protein
VSFGFDCKHFTIGLPADAPDQSPAALFHHVGNALAADAIALDDVIAISFGTEIDDDGEFRGQFTIVYG